MKPSTLNFLFLIAGLIGVPIFMRRWGTNAPRPLASRSWDISLFRSLQSSRDPARSKENAKNFGTGTCARSSSTGQGQGLRYCGSGGIGRRSERGWMHSMPALRKTSSWSPWPISWRASHGQCYPAEKTTDRTATWSQHRELARKRRLRLGSADALPLFYVIPGLIPIGSGMMKDSSATKRPLLYRRNPNGIRRYAHRA
jgi:hypothetical protein